MNPSQREAVFAPVAEPLVLVAPPGSGKTFCLIERLRFVLESGVRPDQVLLLTFTNKAAKEMRERAKMGTEVQLTTFHSFCLRLAREHNFVDRRATVWGDPETKKALRTLLAARVQRDDPGADVSAQALAPLLAKAAALLNKPLRELPAGSDERTLVEAYARLKREQGAVDFDDMIGVVCARVGRMSREASPLARFRVLMVDEWQDTSGTQLELVKLFPTRGITVVGDPHQSIYAFRGAEIGNWQRFAAWLHPRVVRLSTNYRSTSVVSAACQGLIAHNPQPRLGEEEQEVAAVQTVRLERDPVLIVQCTDSATEATFVCATMRRLQREHGVPLAEMAVLYRSNPRQAVSRAFEKELLAARIPYLVVAGQALYEAKTVKQLLSYLRLLLNPRDEMAFSACAKHQKLSKKAFEPAWRSHRGSRTSSDALAAFAASRAPPEASLAPFREGLLRLARLLAAWRPVVASPVTLADFVRTTLLSKRDLRPMSPRRRRSSTFCWGRWRRRRAPR
jgi:DNA helicase-2/ATP-dependent DNA helicase PcrA